MQVGQEELLTAAPQLVADVLRRFGLVRVRASGRSMFPAIRSGDVLTIRHCTVDQLDSGDVVLLLDGDRLFAHRLIAKRTPAGGTTLVTRGDSHWRNDPPRPAAALLGRVIAVERGDMVLDEPFPCPPASRLRGLLVSEWMRLRSRAVSL